MKMITGEMSARITANANRILNREFDEMTIRRRGDGIRIEMKNNAHAETIRERVDKLLNKR